MKLLLNHWGKILTGLIMIGGVAYAGILQITPDQTVIIATQPATLNWVVPTTDQQWAQDDEAESFDLKSGAELNAMRVDLVNSLNLATTSIVEYEQCSQCIYWKFYDELKASYPDQPISWWVSEAQSRANNDTNTREWEIQKYEQSIERIDNELRMRASGYLIVATSADATPTGLFGAAIPPNRIRHLSP